jgi:hypothetical protein
VTRRAALVFLIGILCVARVDAATLVGDEVRLCDRPRPPSASVRPSSLLLDVSAEVASSDFRAAYARLARTLEGAFSPGDRAMPGVAGFLAALRDPQGRTFQIDTAASGANEEKLFETEQGREITLDCGTPVPQYLVDLASVSLVASRISAKQITPDLARRALAVARSSREAESLLKDGLAMWPWELWANGLRLSRDDSAPLFRTQLVLMRPTASIEIDTRNRAAADLNASVMLEPLGFVRYRGSGHSSWWGASLVVTSSTGRGAGVGGVVRWDNYVLGVTRHKGDDGRPDSNFLVLGVELYDVLNRKRAEVKDWDAFREKRTRDLRDALFPP